jgi:DNA-binding transcriptional ArsR family regulator
VSAVIAREYRPSFANTVLKPFVERRTYLNLLFALLGLPLGTFYFVVIVTGLSLGAGMLITIAGIPILVFTLVVCRSLAHLERGLAASLLEQPTPRTIERPVEGSFWQRQFRHLASSARWREVAYLLLRFPIGIATFSIAVTLVGTAGNALAEPFLVGFGLHTQICDRWTIDSVGEALLFVPIGVAVLLVTPGVINAMGRASGAMAVAFLGRISGAELKLAIARSLSRVGEADAFELFRDLELYFGPGPHLTPTRLEATLLALEEAGLVTVSSSRGSRRRYSLSESGAGALGRV